MEGKPLYTYEDFLRSHGVTSHEGLMRAEAISRYFRENPELFKKLSKEYWDETVKDLSNEDTKKPLKIKESE